MSGLLKRPEQSVAKAANTTGLMAKSKHEDDETVNAMLAALAIYRSGERHE